MPLSDKITNLSNIKTENSVYFYPGQLKISYSSLDELKEYFYKLFNSNIRLNDKLKQCELFTHLILKELYKKGVLKADHTMVITDPLIENSLFQEVMQTAYQKTIALQTSSNGPNKIQILKRSLLISIFIDKTNPVKDFYNILRANGSFYSKILNKEINLSQHAQIKLLTTKELEEYIINILCRKALLSQGCSIFTLRLYIPIIIELVLWYSRGITVVENGNNITPQTLSAAIKIVDSYYITNPNFIKMLQGKFIGYIIKVLN